MTPAKLLVMLGGVVKASASPTSVSGTIPNSGTCTSTSTTLSGQGGSGNYDFAWSISGATANSPTSATTNFSKVLGDGDVFSGTAVGKVTDRAKGVSDSANVAVTLESLAAPPGPNFNFTPSPVSMTRSGAGPVSTGVSVVIISGTGGPYIASWSASGDLDIESIGDLDAECSTTLGASETKSGIIFATVTDLNNGGVSSGGVGWSATSS